MNFGDCGRARDHGVAHRIDPQQRGGRADVSRRHCHGANAEYRLRAARDRRAVRRLGELRDPIGYQTNLMVMGPGGYRFADYLRAGIPVSLLVAIISLTLIPVFWHF